MPNARYIDQLFHDIVQQRANSYREKALRIEAQREHQRKAGEAYEKKQLEYIRAAGINLHDFERDQKEESLNLKSYLEQTRPPLISRPTMGAADAISAANRAALFGGVILPPYGGFSYPPEGTKVLPLIPSQIKIESHDTGAGIGWGLATAGPPPAVVEVGFYFVPDQNAHYTFTASFAFHGFYILKADDGVFTSKEASVLLGFSLQAYQYDLRPPKSFPNLIDRDSQKINEFDSYDNVLTFSDSQDFRQGEPVVIIATITYNASARGDGSFAQIDFKDGDANYIDPQYLWVTRGTS
jgi:hypothetical protein